MDWIVAGLTGTLLLIGFVSGTHTLRRWLRSSRARRRYLSGTDRIPLVFPVEMRAPGAEEKESRPDLQLEMASPVAAVANGPKMDLDLPPARSVTTPSRIDFDLPPAWRETEPEQSRPSRSAPTPASVPPPRPAPTPASVSPPPPRVMPSSPDAPVDSGTVRFHRADARTMRLLPGRLEIEEGEDGRAEIRFVDMPGDRMEITFGRRPGEPFRHVQLRSPTVSRDHARMVREDGNWVVFNISETNPIVVNDEVLAASRGHTLRNGDRIEMGEVVFRFRFP